MVVMLPSELMTIENLVDSLNLETWEAWYLHAAPQNVVVHLPKFKYEFKSLLNEHLKNLGLGIAFAPGADFSRISTETLLYISRVIHQTFIDVSEEGTEAAAATIVELREYSAGNNTFIADRPFVYIIKENSTGAIMFMGKVGEPVYE
jgi:serpin B